MKFSVHTPCPSTCGFVFHAEADGPGTDGASFWIERRPPRAGVGSPDQEGTRRYMLAGEALESKPIATRSFPDSGGSRVEEIEVLVQGHTGAILLQDRKIQLRFRTKQGKGSLAFYNSTQTRTEEEDDDVHFSALRITALHRGPLEVDGILARRERELLALQLRPRGQVIEEDLQEAEVEETVVAHSVSQKGADGHTTCSTFAPESPSQHLSQAMFFALGSRTSPSSRSGMVDFRATAPAQAQRQQRATSTAGHCGPRGSRARIGPLQKSLSESMLRKNVGAIYGFTAASTSSPERLKHPTASWVSPVSGQWVPLALNAPSSEQQLLRAVRERGVSSNACTDFIAKRDLTSR